MDSIDFKGVGDINSNTTTAFGQWMHCSIEDSKQKDHLDQREIILIVPLTSCKDSPLFLYLITGSSDSRFSLTRLQHPGMSLCCVADSCYWQLLAAVPDKAAVPDSCSWWQLLAAQSWWWLLSGLGGPEEGGKGLGQAWLFNNVGDDGCLCWCVLLLMVVGQGCQQVYILANTWLLTFPITVE